MIPSYAIIPTSNRPNVALACIETIKAQVDVIYVIDNGDEKEVPDSDDYYTLRLDRGGQLPNLSKIWNIGLEQAQYDAVGRMKADLWDVAILNDDTLVPDGWFDAVSHAMRGSGAAAACSGPMAAFYREPRPVGLHTRMQGWAFMLAGEKGVRANEDLHWWFGDDDLDWKSRQAGGMTMVPGYPVQHLSPNGQMADDLQVRVGQDAQVFLSTWGRMPW